MNVIDILEELEATSGRLLREEILDNNVKNKLLQRIFFASQDPYTDYGVRKFKKVKPVTVGNEDDAQLDVFLKLLDKLAIRELSGNAAKDAVSHHFSGMTARQQKWCERILLKNLRCGVQTSTVNKTWPDLIKEFEVALAKTLKTEHDNGIKILDVVNYPVRVEPKLDGLRCVAVKANGVVTMYTRNGTVLDTLPTIKNALEAADYDNVVLDGEAMGEDWNESASILMARKTKKDDSSIAYNVFDAVMLPDWAQQTCNVPYHERLKLVEAIVKLVPVAIETTDAVIRQVNGATVANEKELMNFYSDTMGHGYEGIMLKDLNAPYRFKRSDAILKMKPVVTYEGVIVGHYEGRAGTKREGFFGGFEVVLPNGVVTRLGGGFNDKLRAEIQLDIASFVGRIVEVEGQPDPMTTDGLTKDGRVRFPVFLRMRDVSDVDPKVMAAYHQYVSNVPSDR